MTRTLSQAQHALLDGIALEHPDAIVVGWDDGPVVQFAEDSFVRVARNGRRRYSNFFPSVRPSRFARRVPDATDGNARSAANPSVDRQGRPDASPRAAHPSSKEAA